MKGILGNSPKSCGNLTCRVQKSSEGSVETDPDLHVIVLTFRLDICNVKKIMQFFTQVLCMTIFENVFISCTRAISDGVRHGFRSRIRPLMPTSTESESTRLCIYAFK